MIRKDRAIFGEVLVNANLQEVWDAWTTEDGAKTFFAPDCKINLRPGGAYEMYFVPESPAGSRGGEGCQVIAIQRLEMLSFTWNAPPSLVEIRSQFTHVTIRYYQTADGTQVELFHDGWGIGAEWDKAFSYFDAAWNKVVLPRLKYRFTHGPIDWQNPPEH
jgi:uncharacterized protein YndB with AHSA1/START domain